MRVLNYFLVAALLLPFCGSAQENDSNGLLPVVQNGKMGYIDKTGKITIPPQFDTSSYMGIPELNSFSEGLAPVKAQGKMGYIDLAGKIVVPPQFKEVKDFSEGLAAVRVGDKWGFSDQRGKLVVAPQFKEVSDFSAGLAPVEVGDKWGYIDKTGRLLIEPQFKEARVFVDGLANVKISNHLYAFISPLGKTVGKCVLPCTSNFHEGLAVIEKLGDWMWLKGYMSKNGAVAIDPQFGEARDFSEGLAAVKYGLKEYGRSYQDVYRTDKLWYYIDQKGVRAIPGDFVWAGDFSEGLAAVRRASGEGIGYIDRTGQLVIKGRFNEAKPFKGGVALVLIGTKWGYIDKSGNYIWEPSK